MKNKKNLFHSTVFRLFVILFVLVIPVNGMTVFLVRQILDEEQQESQMRAESALNTSTVYMTENIDHAIRQLLQISFDDSDAAKMESGMDAYTQKEQREMIYSLQSTLKKLQESSELADIMYMNFPASDYIFCVGSLGTTGQECVEVVEQISEESDMEYGTEWTMTEVAGKTVLVSFNRWNDAEFGIFLNLDAVGGDIPFPEMTDDECLFFTDADEQIFSWDGQAFLNETGLTLDGVRQSGKYNVYESDLFYNIRLVEVSASQAGMGTLAVLTRFLRWTMIAFAVIAVPVLVICLRNWVVDPLNRLTDAIAHVEEGDIAYRIQEKKQSVEFEQINHSFNEMMDQVQELRIDVYEKELERKNITVRYLSRQIQPHFILNALNLLYSYEPEDYELSQRMILCMSKYFRYVVKMNAPFVLLSQEMAHIRNYFEIQHARFPDRFCSIVEYEEELAEALVPPLLIQTFAENAIKYSLKAGEKTTITVHGEAVRNHTQAKWMRITISDNGNGMSEEILAEIEEFERTGKRQPHLGVGIQNTIERLKYLYGGEGRGIRFLRNEQSNGTRVEVVLPLHYVEEGVDQFEDFIGG